ncbi:MAG: DinB family protein [Alphaproteobacteria bacterium]
MQSLLSEHFRTFAHYNAWANERLYEVCAGLPEAQYLEPRPAFFGSLHGALNHILVADRLWLSRLEGRDSGIGSLDQQLYGDFAGLRVARRAEDGLIIAYVEGLEAGDLTTPIRYTNMAGERHQDPLRLILAHMFNHQTHHRGQAHDLLSQTEVAPPPLDLIYFLHGRE